MTDQATSDDHKVLFAGENVAVSDRAVIAVKKPLGSPKHVIDLQNTRKSQVYSDTPIKAYGICLVGGLVSVLLGYMGAAVAFVVAALGFWYLRREAAVLNVVEHGGEYLEVKMKRAEAEEANKAIVKRLSELENSTAS